MGSRKNLPHVYLGNMVSRYRTFEFPEQSLLYRIANTFANVYNYPLAPAAQLSIAVCEDLFSLSWRALPIIILSRDKHRIAFVHA